MGGFRSAADIPIGQGSSSVATADFDGDLNPDLAIVGPSAGAQASIVTILRGDGTGNFTSVLSAHLLSAVVVAAADLDGNHSPAMFVGKQSGVGFVLFNQSQ